MINRCFYYLYICIITKNKNIMSNQNDHRLNFPITSQLVDSFEQSSIPHPEYPDKTITKIQFFTYQVSTVQILIQEILSQVSHGYDFEIIPNIFYNCDDIRYLITTEIIIYK